MNIGPIGALIGCSLLSLCLIPDNDLLKMYIIIK